MQKVYEKLVAFGNEKLELINEYRRLCVQLKSVSALIAKLFELRMDMTKEAADFIKGIFATETLENSFDFSWCEMVYVNITYALKSFVNNEGGRITLDHTEAFKLENTQKLKKNITIFIDYASKGALNAKFGGSKA